MLEKRTTSKTVDGTANLQAPGKSMDGERLIALFTQLTKPLGETLPSSTEVVLHDLSLLPHSIIAIHGDVSGRKLGDAPIDSLRDNVMGLAGDHVVGFYTNLPDGRRICSTTLIIRDVAGTAVAALCINADLSVWDSVQKVLDGMYGRSTRATPEEATREFSRAAATPRPTDVGRPEANQSVHSLATTLIDNAIQESKLPVEIMHKRHKLAVVRDLKSRGIFQLRDGVDLVATSLGVTRFTIYNYLNQLSDDGDVTNTDTDNESAETGRNAERE